MSRLLSSLLLLKHYLVQKKQSVIAVRQGLFRSWYEPLGTLQRFGSVQNGCVLMLGSLTATKWCGDCGAGEEANASLEGSKLWHLSAGGRLRLRALQSPSLLARALLAWGFLARVNSGPTASRSSVVPWRRNVLATAADKAIARQESRDKTNRMSRDRLRVELPAAAWWVCTIALGRVLRTYTVQSVKMTDHRKSFQASFRPILMGMKNLYENGPNPFFLFETKNMVRVELMATVLFRHGFDN